MLLLVACLAGPDTGIMEPPVWSGTQIGEEGDDCPDRSAVESEDALDALRELLSGELAGTFSSTWQGDFDLSLRASADGVGWDLTDCSDETYSAVDTDLLIEGPFTVNETLRLSERGVVLNLEDPGQLSPGQLPEDAGTLVLELRILPPSYEGNARWWLERGGDWEMAPAGTWVWD